MSDKYTLGHAKFTPYDPETAKALLKTDALSDDISYSTNWKIIGTLETLEQQNAALLQRQQSDAETIKNLILLGENIVAFSSGDAGVVDLYQKYCAKFEKLTTRLKEGRNECD